MKTNRLVVFFLLAGMVGGVSAYWIAGRIFGEARVITVTEPVAMPPSRLASYVPMLQGTNIDFTYAAEKTVHAVVHVKVESTREVSQSNPLYEFFYGYRNLPPQQVEGFGSGVIISDDGYIITNNHVIEDANVIKVTLNDRRTFTARLIGTDPTTDIALIKIDEKGLSVIPYGDSEALMVGEWVLAVGNPMNLTSTVTAGIVSAKARELGIIAPEPSPEESYNPYGNRGQNPFGSRESMRRPASSLGIESFIQTDAAVNPGNSGGALVNIKGELVGINTAIASRTGSYAGNSFAVPVTIVRKVVSDLIEFGKVQRAYLGVWYQDMTEERSKELNMNKIEGLYVSELIPGGASEKAGIEPGDVLLAVNGVRLGSSAQLKEQIAKYRPNDKIDVTILRKGKEQSVKVTLQDESGGTSLVRREQSAPALSDLGASFRELTQSERSRLNIQKGVAVDQVTGGKFRRAGIQAGFIITSVDRKPVSSYRDIEQAISSASGAVLIQGVYPNGTSAAYALQL